MKRKIVGGFRGGSRLDSTPTLEQEDNQQLTYVLPGNSCQGVFVALSCIVALMWQQTLFPPPGGIHLHLPAATTLPHNALVANSCT